MSAHFGCGVSGGGGGGDKGRRHGWVLPCAERCIEMTAQAAEPSEPKPPVVAERKEETTATVAEEEEKECTLPSAEELMERGDAPVKQAFLRREYFMKGVKRVRNEVEYDEHGNAITLANNKGAPSLGFRSRGKRVRRDVQKTIEEQQKQEAAGAQKDEEGDTEPAEATGLEETAKTESLGMQQVDLQQIPKGFHLELNGLNREAQHALRKNKYDFSAADDILKSMGI